MKRSERIHEKAAESQGAAQQMCENAESKKGEPSSDAKDRVPKILPEGWVKVVKKRKSGKTSGRYDVYIISPFGNTLRSRTSLQSHLGANYSHLTIEDFDFSVPSQRQLNERSSVVAEHINMDDGEGAATTPGVTEEPNAPPAECAEDANTAEEDPFAEGDRNVTPTKPVGRKRVGSRRRGSARALRDAARSKRPRRSSSTKPETQTRKRKYNRKNVASEKPVGGAAEKTDALSQDPNQQDDCNKADDPADPGDPVPNTEDQAATPPLEQNETESENAGGHSSDGDSLPSSGRTKDPIPRSQVEKRKTSQYFSKKATRDVQLPETRYSLKDYYIRILQQQQHHQLDFVKPDSGSRPMEGNIEEEEQDLSHVAADDGDDDGEDDKADDEADDGEDDKAEDDDKADDDVEADDGDAEDDGEDDEADAGDPEDDKADDGDGEDEAEAAIKSSHLCSLCRAGLDGTNSAASCESMREAESEAAGPSTSQPSGRPKPLTRCPSSQGHHRGGENQLLSAVSAFMEGRQSVQSPMYHFAVSLVPLLENVSEERVVDMRHDMLCLITTYTKERDDCSS